MPEQAIQSRTVRVVRILFIRKTGEHQARLIAFITNGYISDLTEEYLLAQPRIDALGIERIISTKECRNVNLAASRWFSRSVPENERSETIIDEALAGIEAFMSSVWDLHDTPSVRMTRIEPRERQYEPVTKTEGISI
jgi:hypothetical protein